ncbi:MAG: o-succinylbenzoate synthase [Desulfosalsimonadaceae bacterium]
MTLIDMMIADICVYYFRLPFVRPMVVGKHILREREGFLLRLADGEGNTGYGEVAPLQGLDAVTLQDCRRELHAFSRVAKAGVFADLPFHPVVNFGIESALFSLAAGKSVGVEDCPEKRIEADINGLFVPDMDPEAEREQAERLLQCGFSTIKVKIGRFSLAKEAVSIRRLFERGGENLLLRLDGNRSLSPAVYERYFQEMRDLPVEYVEEPLKNGDLEWAGGVGWPLAVDESLPLYWDKEKCRFHGLPEAVTRVVVKPSTPAGFREVMQYFSEEKSQRLLPVVSSAFNSVYGICSLLLFLHQLPGADRTAHGLDTGSFLKSDLAENVFRVANGRLSARVNLLWEKDSPDDRVLTEIDL